MSAPAAADAILAAARELKQLLGSRANDTVAVREHHSHGESYHTPAAPDIVCFPQTTAEVAAIVKIAASIGWRSCRSAPGRRWKGTSTRSAAA